ncbi:MAG: DUF896 domain-containing protein [Clostridia bacterium]|nr:DUF896 domain-containing protein [Clostridia bacterium]
MEQSKIDRINILARKSKAEGLTEAEAAEQKQLRAEYIASFRQSLTNVLSNTYIQMPDGKKVKVEKKK